MEKCPKCGGTVRVLAGCSAHRDNWYCEDESGCGWKAWEARKSESSASPACSTAAAVSLPVIEPWMYDELGDTDLMEWHDGPQWTQIAVDFVSVLNRANRR